MQWVWVSSRSSAFSAAVSSSAGSARPPATPQAADATSCMAMVTMSNSPCRMFWRTARDSTSARSAADRCMVFRISISA